MSALVRIGQCIKCLATQDEPARPGCKNPDWHAAPPPEPEDGEASDEFILASLEADEPEEDGPFA